MKHTAATTLVFVLAVLILWGCAPRPKSGQEALPEERQGQEETTSTQREATQQAQGGGREGKFGLGVGETAELVRGQYKGLKLTLMEAFTTRGGRYDKSGLKGADTYLVARFRAQNEGPRTVDMVGSGIDFIAYNQDSYELDSYTLEAQYQTGANREDQELMGQVRPGGDVVGTVAFAVKNTDSVLVEYTPLLQPLASWEVGPVTNLSTGELGGLRLVMCNCSDQKVRKVT
jgi:hypothetical protein